MAITFISLLPIWGSSLRCYRSFNSPRSPFYFFANVRVRLTKSISLVCSLNSLFLVNDDSKCNFFHFLGRLGNQHLRALPHDTGLRGRYLKGNLQLDQFDPGLRYNSYLGFYCRYIEPRRAQSREVEISDSWMRHDWRFGHRWLDLRAIDLHRSTHWDFLTLEICSSPNSSPNSSQDNTAIAHVLCWIYLFRPKLVTRSRWWLEIFWQHAVLDTASFAFEWVGHARKSTKVGDLIDIQVSVTIGRWAIKNELTPSLSSFPASSPATPFVQ